VREECGREQHLQDPKHEVHISLRSLTIRFGLSAHGIFSTKHAPTALNKRLDAPKHVNGFLGWLVFLIVVLNEFGLFGFLVREARQTGFKN
jgi:hypothetical protein